MLSHAPPAIRISSAANRLANRLLDRLLRIDHRELLNAGPVEPAVTDPARELRRLSTQMRATAVEASTRQVDYAALALSEPYARFQRFARALPACALGELGDRSQRLAFWINLYNALVQHGVIHYRVSDSVLSDLGFFRRVAYDVGGMRFSADDIEHGVLRGNARHPYLPFRQFAADDPRTTAAFRPPDPRLHFALVCGAQSCPPVAAYDGEHINAQLAQATAAFIQGGGARYDAKRRQLWISRIFKWYESDFGGRREVLGLLAEHLGAAAPLDQAELKYLPYDWSLNGRGLDAGTAS